MSSSKRKNFNEDFFARLLARRPQDAAVYRSELTTIEARDPVALEDGLSPRDRALETIVSRERPVLSVSGQGIDFSDLPPIGLEAREMVDKLRAKEELVNAAINLVGRIDVDNFPNGLSFVGSGWLIADGVVVTNRHVAKLIAAWDGRGYSFLPGVRGQSMNPGLNFGHWTMDGVPAGPRLRCKEVLYIEPDVGPYDIAFLKLEGLPLIQGAPFLPVIDSHVPVGRSVCVIGYPAKAPRRVIPDQALMEELYRGKYDVKRVAPGLMIGTSMSDARHDCTTLGGNSGSVVLDVETGKAAGLHYAGLYQQTNYAIPASVLRDYVARRRWTRPPDVQTRAPDLTAPPPASNDTVTLTVPVTITISLAGASAGEPQRSAAPANDVARVEAVASLYWRSKPNGAVAVRVGYDDETLEAGGTPILVVSVLPEEMSNFAAAPRSFQGIAIRYEGATVIEQLEARASLEAIESVNQPPNCPDTTHP